MKDKYGKYYQQISRLLVEVKRFQEAVKKTRKNLGIPKSGFPRSKRADWYQQFFNKSDLSKEEMRRHFRIYSNQELLPPNKTFITEIQSLLKNFNLDEIWTHNIFVYLVTGNKLEAPFGFPNVDVKVNNSLLPEDEMEVTHLSLVINKDTSLKDIKNIWSQVQKYQSMMPVGQSRKKPWSDENYQKYLDLRKMESIGYTHKKIADKLEFQDAQAVSDFKKSIESRFLPS